jgi:hypothetical protein
VGTFDVSKLPFPHFSKAVTVTVRARDEAGNQGTGTAPAAVTRALWSWVGGAPMTAAAVAPDGGAVVGLDRSERQLVKVSAEGARAWEATVGDPGIPLSHGIVGAPAVGTDEIFVGGMDGNAYRVGLAGVVPSGPTCIVGAGVTGAALNSKGNTGFFGSGRGAVVAVSPGVCEKSEETTFASSLPLVGSESDSVTTKAIYSVTGPYLISRSYTSPSTFVANWFGVAPPAVGTAISVPSSIDTAGNVWTLSTDGKLNSTTPAGATTTVRTLAAGASGPIILSDGTVVVGDAGRIVHRIDPTTGADVWASADLGAISATALVLAGSAADLLVPAVDGVLHALRSSDGGEVWSIRLSATGDLKPGNVYTPAGSSRSIGYFPSSDGTLYAVLLDGTLDRSAPWPKAFHDARNTSNASTPLP